MGPFEQHSERLLERGYAIVPIIPGTKKPGFFHNGNWVGLMEWTKRFNGRASLVAERQRWGRFETGIGVLGGPASSDLVGIDLDTEDPQIVAALLTVLPPTEVKKAGARGETRFYYGPGIGSCSWSIDDQRIIEIIGPGRQTVLPPTVHPDGTPYRWLGPETLEDLEPRELPALPADIAIQISAVLEPFGYRPLLAHEAREGDTPHRQLNEAALAKLADWVPFLKLYKARRTPRGYEAVAVWRPSSSGRPDQARSRNLKIVPEGIRDFGAGTGYTPLDLTMAALGCDLDAAFAFLADRLGWGTAEVSIGLAENSGNLENSPGPVGNGAGSAGNGENDAEDEARTGPDPLEPYTQVPGAVGDIIDWITSTARRPNRILVIWNASSLHYKSARNGDGERLWQMQV